MLTVYIVCAVVGGIILLLQLVLTVTGLVGEADDLELDDGEPEADSSDFFKLLSFRALVAALTFFGLGGGLGHSAGLPDIISFVFGAVIGIAAMFGVAWLFSLLTQLSDEGNVQIEYALNAPAVVYLGIPGQRRGMGKVTVNVQDRSMELDAVTAGDDLPTGRTVTIVNIVDATTVEVAEQH